MQTLARKIGTLHGLVLAVSLVVGSGLFGLPGIALQKFGNESSLVAWFATTLLLLPLIHIFCRLGRRFPTAGGLTAFASHAFGPWAATAVSLLLLASIAIGVPSCGMIATVYIRKFLGLPDVWQLPLTLLLFGLIAGINALGVRWGSLVNLASSAVLVTVMVGLVLKNLPSVGAGLSILLHAAEHPGTVAWPDVRACSLIFFWAFIGWEELSFGLEEFRDPDRTIPRVYWLSFGLVSFLYLFLALAASGASALGIEVTGPGGLAALAGHGTLGRLAVGGMVLVAIANVNANIFAHSRFVFDCGRTGLLPRPLGMLSKSKLPLVSIAATTLLYCAVTIVSVALDLNLATLLALVDQNFVVLYVFAVVAYLKIEQGHLRWGVAASSLVSCFFFLSSVGWGLLVPAALVALGYFHHARTVDAAAREEAEAVVDFG